MSNEVFKNCLEFVLQWEGGYVNHPNDPGGATNKGVIQKVYDEYRLSKNLLIQSVKQITDLEVEEIYYKNYWIKSSSDRMPTKIALVHFDTSVNCGVNQSSKFLQRSLNVKDDGIIGLVTLSKLNESVYLKTNFCSSNINKLNENNIELICSNYINQRKNYYILISERNSKLKVFLKGWNNRVSALEKIINKL